MLADASHEVLAHAGVEAARPAGHDVHEMRLFHWRAEMATGRGDEILRSPALRAAPSGRMLGKDPA